MSQGAWGTDVQEPVMSMSMIREGAKDGEGVWEDTGAWEGARSWEGAAGWEWEGTAWLVPGRSNESGRK